MANRRLFDDLLEKEWRRCLRNSRPIALVMIDIDFFKQFNDHYGHQLGDLCLKQVAQALAVQSQRPADLLARYGGEEFVLLLPEIDSKHAALLAEKCRTSVMFLNILHEPSSISRVATISCGVCSMVPNEKDNCSLLIKQADQALYMAKGNGRNRVEVCKW